LSKWTGGKETDFTKSFAACLDTLFKTHFPTLECKDEGIVKTTQLEQVGSPPNVDPNDASGRNRVDITIHKKKDKSLVALLEFGITKKDDEDFSVFMGKIAQGVHYLRDLLPNPSHVSVRQDAAGRARSKKDKVIFERPVLLPIIVFNESYTTMAIAVFCSEKRMHRGEGDDVRLSLLFRKYAKTRTCISDILVDLVDQVLHFASVQKTNDNFMYLGPNCALVNENGADKVILQRFMFAVGIAAHC
jgi:hypothetical protein